MLFHKSHSPDVIKYRFQMNFQLITVSTYCCSNVLTFNGERGDPVPDIIVSGIGTKAKIFSEVHIQHTVIISLSLSLSHILLISPSLTHIHFLSHTKILTSLSYTLSLLHTHNLSLLLMHTYFFWDTHTLAHKLYLSLIILLIHLTYTHTLSHILTISLFHTTPSLSFTHKYFFLSYMYS